MKMRFDVSRVVSYLRRNMFLIFVIAMYMVFTAYYMGPSVISCGTTTYGFGDNTAGPIWRATLPEEQGIIGSRTNMTNAPYGDVLENPIGYSLILQLLLIQGSQAVGGPVCGYNIVNMLGFFASALTMFGFIFALTRHRWIAFVAGYAVAFTPYYQMKVGGHPSYGFQAIFIGLIWLFYRVITYRKKSDSIALGLLFGVAVYFDPYFSLFAAVILGSLGMAWLLFSRQVFTKSFWKNKKESTKKTELKRLVLAAVVSVMTVMPLLGVYISSYSQIHDNVAVSRGNVVMEAKACSNWPHEYVTPFVLHPVFRNLFGDEKYVQFVDYLKNKHSCGIGEDSVGLSVILVLVTVVGLGIFMWEKLNKRRLGLARMLVFNPRIVIFGLLLLGFVAAAFALPPGKLRGVIPTPSYLLLDLTETWRTLARFYMMVNISLVTIASIVLTYAWMKFGKKYTTLLSLLLVALFIGIFVEYQAFRPFAGNEMSTFNYTRDTPTAYQWLKERDDIQTIAEYPLERYGQESDAMSYYLTMQVIHQKKLFNSAVSYNQQEEYKDSLKNLSDPQTLPSLKAQGVDAVVVHGVPEQLLKALDGEIIFSAPQATFNINSHSPVVKDDNIVILSLKNTVPADYYIDLGDGFARNTSIINSVVDWRYEAINKAMLKVRSFKDEKIVTESDSVKLCFSAQMSVPEEVTNLTVVVDGDRKEDMGMIHGELSRYEVVAKKSVQLITGNGHNMRLTSLGCASE